MSTKHLQIELMLASMKWFASVCYYILVSMTISLLACSILMVLTLIPIPCDFEAVLIWTPYIIIKFLTEAYDHWVTMTMMELTLIPAVYLHWNIS